MTQRYGRIHAVICGAALIAATSCASAAADHELPSASPGGTCKVPGEAATYGVNGMLVCSASLTWKSAITATTPTYDSSVVSTVGRRLNRAMAAVVDGAGDFLKTLVSPSSD